MLKDKKNIFRVVLAVWVILWLFFLIREDKDGQYRFLMHLYSADHADKVRFLMGNELYDFLVFCKENIPEYATYKISGFEKFSIYEVRARYFLWPIRSVDKNADFEIFFKKHVKTLPGYEEYKDYKGIGYIYRRRDSD